MAHVTTQDISEYIEHEAKKTVAYVQDTSCSKMASRLGTAEALLFTLILDLEPEVRTKRVKEILRAIA